MSRPHSLDALPQALRAPLSTLLDDLVASYSANLRAVCLYGSGATEEFVHRRSTPRILVVLDVVDAAAVRQAALHWPRWRSLGVVAPLFLTLEQIRSSLDVFPLEFLEMQARHLTLLGEDPLADLTFGPAAVRQQCERELRGSLITIREGFIETGHDAKALESLLLRAFSGIQRILLGLLWLRKKTAPPTNKELLTKVEEAFGVSTEPFRELHALKQGASKPAAHELEALFGRLHDALDRLVQAVDRLVPA